MLPEPIWRHGGAGAGGPCAAGEPRAVQGRTAPKRGLLSFMYVFRAGIAGVGCLGEDHFVRAKPTWFPNVPLLKTSTLVQLPGAVCFRELLGGVEANKEIWSRSRGSRWREDLGSGGLRSRTECVPQARKFWAVQEARDNEQRDNNKGGHGHGTQAAAPQTTDRIHISPSLKQSQPKVLM